jgi:hypothetical protein
MTTPKRLRCRFCSYSVLAFRVTKKGERKSGYGLLRAHVEGKHPALWEEIQESIDRQCEDIPWF